MCHINEIMHLVDDDYKVSWDGSHLGEYHESVVMARYDLFPYDLYILYNHLLSSDYIICTMHASKNKYPCIVDEAKVVMGMVKIGTHSITIGRTLHIMYNTGKAPVLLKGVVPNRILLPNDFKQMVQDVYVFRMIFGFGCNFDSSIMLVRGVPSSYRNNLDVRIEKGFDISNVVLDEWFVDSIANSKKRMISPSERTCHMRTKIQKVIRRIDPQLIWIDNQIIDRMFRIE